MVSNFFIGTSLEIVSCLQWAIISQWISSHRFSCRYMGYILLRYHANPLTCNMRLSSDAFALGEGPTRGGLAHMGFHAAAANCASSRHSILRLWRGPSPRAYARGLSHIGFHAIATNCASSRHSILRLWRGPSPRAYSRGISSHRLSCRCDELCLFEALYPAPLARPFSKGLLAGIISHRLSCRCSELCLFKALQSSPFGAALLQGPSQMGGIS